VRVELADEFPEAVAINDIEEVDSSLIVLWKYFIQIGKHGDRADSMVRTMMQRWGQ